MNEVEKLYKNAEIKQIIVAYNCHCAEGDCIYDNPHCVICHYSKPSRDYPSLTAEKQLELIKWLGKSKNGFGLFNDGTEGLSCHCDFNWEWFHKDFYAENFDNALAGLINSLWQDLTAEERKQIKEILG